MTRRTSSSPAGAGLTFNDFLLHMAPIVALELAAFVVMLPLLFRGSFPPIPSGSPT